MPDLAGQAFVGRRRRFVVVIAVAAWLALPRPAHADSSGGAPTVREAGLGWLVTQAIPSPELALAHGDAVFGARWQITPLLYAFGIHRGAPPLRAFLVEPVVRHGGSLEAFFSPEYLARSGDASRSWFLRPGLRAYFPLVEHGDTLSCSVGTSYAAPLVGRGGVAYEAGLYTLFGVLGVQLTYSPTREPATWMTTLSVRYF